MEKLTAEMKAEIQAQRLAAEVNAKLRTKAPEPKFQEPQKPIKVLTERPQNLYKTENTVSSWYWEYEERGIEQSTNPTYRPRR